MEHNNAEIEKKGELPKVTSDIKVLEIGDRGAEGPGVEPDEGSKQNAFIERCRRHLCYLLTGEKTPIDVPDDWKKYSQFGVSSVKKPNEPRRYHFLNLSDSYWPPGMISSGLALYPRDTLKVVKEKLKDENWISDNVIETPLRTQGDFHDNDLYIQYIVAQSLDAESNKFFNYILFLHRSKGKYGQGYDFSKLDRYK